MILCCGEALIDMLPRTSTEGEACYAPYAGGAVFNTAIALGRLGAETGFYSGIAQDMMGDLLTETLVNSKVDTSAVVYLDRPSTVAFIKLVDGQATYAFYDENTAGRMLSKDDLPTEVAADTLFFGGISLPVDPCGATYEALCHREAANKVIMIDPNIRPGFIRDEATYRARIEGMLAVADIIKVSDEDLTWLFGEGDMMDHARKLISNGAKLVCITEGAKGSYGITAENVVFVEAQKATVVDTVGAGDTFNAGVLASLQSAGKLTKAAVAELDEDTIRTALSLGNRAAAVTVSRAGANPPWSNEL
ncbi:carbohydrate kinase family protein [Marivivens donghaensis]|uniref:carbohydrate kinase family protein n=1 Tax=Marivivens donghaensis TaxID=1699413 RepID=UPI00201F7051|nr:carbohydrate kinase [Marivivens donghaensis]MCL7407790.1 carbohydrate kinase [Marivivens donghaensis]MDN3704231.1 carbohydrate kinase [Marivivens donghaensis]